MLVSCSSTALSFAVGHGEGFLGPVDRRLGRVAAEIVGITKRIVPRTDRSVSENRSGAMQSHRRQSPSPRDGVLSFNAFHFVILFTFCSREKPNIKDRKSTTCLTDGKFIQCVLGCLNIRICIPKSLKDSQSC